MTRRRRIEKFAVGERVMFPSDSSDMLNGHDVAGEIVSLVEHFAVIRPDEPIDGTAVIVTRPIRELRKETASEDDD